jgi:hypothetical protein
MSVNIHASSAIAELPSAVTDTSEEETSWLEIIVTALAASVAVLLASSLAVLTGLT